MWTPPTVAEFKAKFYRDFPYSPSASDKDNLDFVADKDISNAITEALAHFNTSLFGDNTTLFFMYLVAHTLVMNIRVSTSGLASTAKFAVESASVGSVSVSNLVNERFASDPFFSSFLTTGYGKKYLEFVYPYTVGNVDVNCGGTTFA